MQRDCTRKGAVTVLEVVMTFCIVAVLAAIVFPAFARTKVSNAKSSCQNNLKECGIALQLYWNDYDGVLPSSMAVKHAKEWNREDFLKFATKHGTVPVQGNRHAQTWTELLYDHMKNKDTVWCPSDPVDRSNPQAQASYWWKLAIDKAWYGEGCARSCKTEGAFAYNADQIVFYEHQGWHFGQTHGLKNDVRINVAYLDSHVKTVTIRNATSGDPVNCAANSDGEPMYFNFDNDKAQGDNNPSPTAPAKYIDPGRYSDALR